MVPFIVEGNARNMEPTSSRAVEESGVGTQEDGKYCVAGNTNNANKKLTGTRKFKILKWIFTEAQCGKTNWTATSATFAVVLKGVW